MKLIIGGSSHFTDYVYLKQRVSQMTRKKKPKEITVYTTDAKGASALGKQYAEEQTLEYKCFITDWEGKGKQAAILRDDDIIKNATHAIIFDDGKDTYVKPFIDKLKENMVNTVVFKIKEKKEEKRDEPTEGEATDNRSDKEQTE